MRWFWRNGYDCYSSASVFNKPGAPGAHVRMQIRLATVVSESAGGVILFLPAAGCRRGGTFDRPGTLGVFQSVKAHTASVPGLALFEKATFTVPYTVWGRNSLSSVRLATVVSEMT